MNDQLPMAVLGWCDERRSTVATRLGEHGFAVVLETSETEAVEAELNKQPKLTVYVDLDSDAEKGLSWLESLPERRFSVLAGGPDATEMVLRSMRAGAVAYFPGHVFDEELDRARERLKAPPAASDDPEAGGRLVAVLGAKGGVGTTTIACELAAALHRAEERVVIVDAKPYFGDVALHLDVEPAHGLGDPVAKGQEIDESFLELAVHEHASSGVSVVAAPVDPDDVEGVDGAHVRRVCELLRTRFDWVVVDLPRLTDDIAIDVVEIADQVILVTLPSLAGIARARQHQQFLGELGVEVSKTRLVLNQTDKGDLFGSDPSEAVGIEAAASIPVDPSLKKAAEAGRPMLSQRPSGEAADRLVALAESLRPRFGAETQETQNEGGLRARIRRFVEDVRCRLANA